MQKKIIPIVLFSLTSCFVFPISLAASGQPLITIVDESQGCFHSRKSVTTYEKKGDNFVSKSKQVSDEDVKTVVKALVDSQKQSTLNLDALGITRATVAAHHDDMVAAALQWEKSVPKEIAGQKHQSFEYKNVAEIATKCLSWNDRSTTHTNFSVTIDDGSGVPISASSEHQCAWMLPWQVNIGSRHWQTYSLAVPKALLMLADPKGPNHIALDGAQFWQKGFWQDPLIWNTFVGRQLQAMSAASAAEDMAGYKKAVKQFEIAGASFGSINAEPYSLYLVMKTRQPALINEVWWWNHMSADQQRPKSDWNAFLSQFQSCTDAVAKAKWLSQWKSAGSDRTLQCLISGTHCYEGRDAETRVLNAWTDAGLSGHPEIEIRLRRRKDFAGTVYLSTSDNHALIAYAKKSSGPHWLDQQEIEYFPPTVPTHGAPTEAKYYDYLVVDTDGGFQKRTTLHK